MDSPLLLLSTGFTRNSLSRHPALTPNVCCMEKPEWFETMETSENSPKSIMTSSARAHRVRLTQGLALLGIASVIAVGGFSFVQSANAPSTLSASAVPVATASSPTAISALSSTTPPIATTATAAAASSPAIGLTAGRPTITSAVGGEGND